MFNFHPSVCKSLLRDATPFSKTLLAPKNSDDIWTWRKQIKEYEGDDTRLDRHFNCKLYKRFCKHRVSGSSSASHESFDCGKWRAAMARVEVLSGRRSWQTMRHSGVALSGRQLRYRRQTRNHRRYRRPRSDYANNKMQRNRGGGRERKGCNVVKQWMQG